jgi:hypothetical protein
VKIPFVSASVFSPSISFFEFLGLTTQLAVSNAFAPPLLSGPMHHSNYLPETLCFERVKNRREPACGEKTSGCIPSDCHQLQKEIRE